MALSDDPRMHGARQPSVSAARRAAAAVEGEVDAR